MKFPKFLRVVVRAKNETVAVNSTTVIKKHIFNAIDAQFTDILAQTLGFSYQLLSPTDGEFGRPLGNGTWTGMVGMLQRNEGDLVVGMLAASEQRLQVVDFSYPFNRGSITFATRKPEYAPEPGSFLWPFSFEVWALIVACLLIMPVAFYFLLSKRYSYQRLVLITLSTILEQSMEINSSDDRDRMLLFCWNLGAMFLGYCYTALLLSFLTFPPLHGVRTIPELANAVATGKYQCTCQPGSFIIRALLSSPDSNCRIIGQNLLQNDGSRDIDGVLGNRKSTENPAFVTGEVFLFPYRTKYYVSKDAFFPSMIAIALRKGFCCKDQLNRVISYIWSSGIYRKLTYDDGFLQSLKIISNTENISNFRRLGVKDIQGAFILITFGYSLAVIVFILELIIHNSCKRVRLRLQI